MEAGLGGRVGVVLEGGDAEGVDGAYVLFCGARGELVSVVFLSFFFFSNFFFLLFSSFFFFLSRRKGRKWGDGVVEIPTTSPPSLHSVGKEVSEELLSGRHGETPPKASKPPQAPALKA